MPCLRALLPAVLILVLCFSACSKSDEGIAPNAFVGRWYLTAYMEDANGNRTNDDAKLPLQSFESCSLDFKPDGKLTIHTQHDQSIFYDLSYVWTVTSGTNVVLHLTETTPAGTNKYDIAVAAVSNKTLVLLHDNYATVQALRFQPPHYYSTNWLIFTGQ